MAYTHDYPRICATEYSGHNSIGDTAYRDRLAKFDITLIGFWRNWSGSGFSNLAQLHADIVSRAPVGHDLKIGKYTVFNEVTNDVSDAATADIQAKLLAESNGSGDWFARDAGGQFTSSFGGTKHTNITRHVDNDGNGDSFPEWLAARHNTEFFSQIAFDIWFFDNWFERPRVNADWQERGSNDSPTTVSVQTDFQDGMIDALTRAKALQPSVVMLGNVDGHPGLNRGMLTESRYTDQLNAYFEFAIGESFSVETWGGFESCISQYNTTLSNTSDDVCIFNTTGTQFDYQEMRYGLGACLLNDGYFSYTGRLNASDHHNGAWWYDEYDLNLGQPTSDAPLTSNYGDGLFIRYYENGAAIVNPRGNGTKTVEIPAGLSRFSGTQDSTRNDGSTSSFSMSERDAVVLIGTAAGVGGGTSGTAIVRSSQPRNYTSYAGESFATTVLGSYSKPAIVVSCAQFNVSGHEITAMTASGLAMTRVTLTNDDAGSPAGFQPAQQLFYLLNAPSGSVTIQPTGGNTSARAAFNVHVLEHVDGVGASSSFFEGTQVGNSYDRSITVSNSDAIVLSWIYANEEGFAPFAPIAGNTGVIASSTDQYGLHYAAMVSGSESGAHTYGATAADPGTDKTVMGAALVVYGSTSAVLSDPDAVADSATTANAQVTTTASSGDIDSVVTEEASPPTVTQIENAQDETGTAVGVGKSQTVTVTASGLQNFSYSSMSGASAKYVHFTDGTDVVSSAAFYLLGAELSEPSVQIASESSATAGITVSKALDVYALARLSSDPVPGEAAVIADGSAVMVSAAGPGPVQGFVFDGLAAGSHIIDFAANGSGVVSSAAFTLATTTPADSKEVLMFYRYAANDWRSINRIAHEDGPADDTDIDSYNSNVYDSSGIQIAGLSVSIQSNLTVHISGGELTGPFQIKDVIVNVSGAQPAEVYPCVAETIEQSAEESQGAVVIFTTSEGVEITGRL